MSRLLYDKPAGREWNRGLPVGNGKIGAMILGDTVKTVLMLNEDSLWYGGPIDRVNQDAKENLPKVRELILSGRIPEAEQLMLRTFSAVPTTCRTYSVLGNLTVRYTDPQDGLITKTMYSNNIPAICATVNPDGTAVWKGLTFPLIER